MKRILFNLLLAFLSFSVMTAPAEARRLGGGTSSGMKRQTPPPQPTQSVPAQPAATPNAAGAMPAAAAAPKRSWMGPVAGLAAGLGLAALMSHFGMGGDFANMLTMVLLAGAAFFVIRFLLRRFAPGAASGNRMVAPQGLQFAGAGGAGFLAPGPTTEPSLAAPPAVPSSVPPGFDAPAFERVAKLIFIRMQASNDAGNLEDLRQFATPEMFATFRLELQDRKGAAQQTDVMQLEAQILDFAQESERQVVSVRFHGLIREEKDAAAEAFDETWHLVKPTDGHSEWAIAGIAQRALA